MSQATTPLTTPGISPNTDNVTPDTNVSSATASPVRKYVLDNLSKLMTTCVILRVEDFTLFRVTTSGKKQMPKEFLSGM